MYRKRENQWLLPHEFFLPFAGKLNEENRWVKLAQLIPWNLVEEHYAKLRNFPEQTPIKRPLPKN